MRRARQPLHAIGEADVADLALGCAVLGSGGGGDVALARDFARATLAEHGPARVLPVERLDASALVMPCGLVGSPLALEERLLNGDEPFELARAVEQEHGRPVDAVMAFEMAGANGLFPVAWAAALGVPLLDADGMGRPVHGIRTVMGLSGVPATPAFLVDGDGQRVTLHAGDPDRFSTLLFCTVEGLGGFTAIAFHLLDAQRARTATIPGSVTRALTIGREHDGSAAAIVAAAGGTELLTGKVVQLQRRSPDQTAGGSLLIERVAGAVRRMVRVEFREEYLVALENGRVSAATPDVIAVLDAETGWPLLTEDARYGQIVTVMACASHEAWGTTAGLVTTGHAAFDLELPGPG